MNRFLLTHQNIQTGDIQLTNRDEIHHLKNVLHLKVNERVSIFDGKGKEGVGKIASISDKSVTISIEKVNETKPKSSPIILACAIPKKSKFETIIEKATELGVDEIIPLKTKRTEMELTGDRLKKKQTRYETVAISASKQSQRSILPVIHPITGFNEALSDLLERSSVLMPSLMGECKPLMQILPEIPLNKPISFLIGPEGDFTTEEYEKAHLKGAIPVSLGTNILRVETAALAVMSAVSLHQDAHST